MVGYSQNERNGEEKDSFWNDMARTLDSIGNEYRLCILNGWIGDRTRACIIGAFGVPGENDNGRKVVKFYAERGMCMGNLHFKHRSLHKYTTVARVQDGVDIKSMIDLVLVMRDMLQYVQDVRAVRGMG